MQTETLTYNYNICVLHDDDNLVSYVVDNGKTVKKFKGESAWMDAERFAEDLEFERMYA